MATNDELEKTIEQLRGQITSLQDGFEKFQALLLNVIETKQLKVDENAQIAGRDISQTLEAFEQKLNSHDATLSSHDANITAAQSTANTAVSAASNAQNTADSGANKADAAQATANDAVNRANNAQSAADSGVNKANAAQSTANTAQGTANQALKTAQAVDARTVNISTDGKGKSTKIDAGNKFLAIQSDGNVVVYRDDGHPLWDTRTF